MSTCKCSEASAKEQCQVLGLLLEIKDLYNTNINLLRSFSEGAMSGSGIALRNKRLV